MAYVKMSVDKPGLNKGAGGDKKDRIILFDMDDLTSMPERDDKGITTIGNIGFKAGAYMVTIYATSSSVKVSSSTEGDQDAQGFIHNLEFEHPGNELAIREFKQNWLSRNIGAIVEHCSSNKKDLLGTPCAPLSLSIKWEDDKDKNKTTFTLKSSLKAPYDVADYVGTSTYASVVATVPAAATNIDLVNGEGRYQLTSGTSAAVVIATCTNPVNGMVFTLLGSGGAWPSTIPAGGSFELANGTTYTALVNTTITFKAFKNGASTYKYIEQSRT